LIYSILDATHHGVAYAMSAADLIQQLQWRGFPSIRMAQMRAEIHDMRKAGILIASGQSGYYIPQALAEVLAFVDEVYRQPSRDQLHTARILREQGRRAFGGQQTLPGM
jgi:hypothetical protein